MPIKLVHFTSSLKVGGAETVLFELVQSLPAGQFQQTVLYVHDGPYKKQLQALGIPCYQISGLLFRYDPIFLWLVYRTIKKLNPDCLHTSLWAANCAGRSVACLLGIPVVSVYHNNVDQDGSLRNFTDRFTMAMTKSAACAGGTKLVAVSDEVAGSLHREYGARSCAVQVIKNGVNCGMIREKSARLIKNRASFGFSPVHVVIGSVGRFEPVKRYDLLLESFAHVHATYRHVRLLLVGSGSQKAALRELAVRLGIEPQVQFVADFPAYGYYPIIDIFVQTSDKEGISLALLEAMSLGLSCVATHAGEKHPVITHEKDGLVLPAGNVGALADALEQLTGNFERRKELGARAQKKVQEEFSQGVMQRAYAELFSAMSKRRQAKFDF